MLVLALACGSSDPPVRRYHARGVVAEVSKDQGLSVVIHHERIDPFEDRDGKKSSMDSMKMLFGVASDVPKDVFQSGEKLAFDFDVRWDRQPTLLVVKAERLSAETPLELHETHH
jgi:Cu/Ag efflux protein CusF